jgi:predicted GNAT family acetyltransferase
MHLEEVGINPLERDAVGYRQRVRELIDRKRSFVTTDGGRIVFKCELSAVTDEAAQIMGVWTSPSVRRRGFARRGMAEVCGHLLRQGKAVTLFVNDFNLPAIALYESLGFRRIGTHRALIW